MNFAPLNEDHAVQSVSFEIAMNRLVDVSDLRALAQEYRPFAEELPATGSLGQENVSAELAYRRPDGSAIWAFRASGNEFVVECTRYTRWEKVWAQGSRYLLMGLRAASTANPETRFGGLTLKVIDKFTTAEVSAEKYRLADLLNDAGLMAQSLFDRGSAWHSNIGWFEDLDDNLRCLTQLNLSGTEEGELNPSTGDVIQKGVVEIAHAQQLREADLTLDALNSMLSDRMSLLHNRNKELLSKLLTRAMQERISLWSPE